MTVNVNYPLPTVHNNGTSKSMLLEDNVKILSAIADLKEAINTCEFHGRDYYVQDSDPNSYAPTSAFSRAVDERTKHINNIIFFSEYINKHIEHVNGQ
tara:strand:+ start:1476 stop:1769 length:294 start_codon:yes stop_codon:yes gene_type:complete